MATAAVAPTPETCIRAARTLPTLLSRFLSRYPPGTFPVPATTSTSTHSIPVPDTSSSTLTERHPFRAWRNPITQRWRPPVYSLKDQARLFSLAREHGVLSLLPAESVKNRDAQAMRRMEEGLRTKGTGAGQKVKGKQWERRMNVKLETRVKAMEAMPALIKEWKVKGHGRQWKKWPSR